MEVMDSFTGIFNVLTGNLKNDGMLETTSQEFAKIQDGRRQYFFCLKLLQSHKLLPPIRYGTKKSSEKSERHRNVGNAAFLKKKDLESLHCYSSSIACAPVGSKELALGYANRSAATFRIGEFKNSIKDIDRALAGKYPDNLKYKLYERKGNSLLQSGRTEDAKLNFKEAIKWLSKSTSVNEEKKKTIEDSLQQSLNDCNCEEEMEEIEEVTTNVGIGFLKKNFTGSEASPIPTLSYERNMEVPCASTAIRIEYSQEMGRHLVATRDINPGDVLVVEKPYSSLVLPSTFTLHCFQCLKRCHSLVPCTRCSNAMYCSQKCIEKSWRANHSTECGFLPALLHLGCGKLELLAVRTLLVASKSVQLEALIEEIDRFNSSNQNDDYGDPRTLGYNEDARYISSDYRTVHFLAVNSHLRSNADLFRRALYAVCIVHCISQCSDYFHLNASGTDFDQIERLKGYAGGLLVKYLQMMPCNAHEVSEMCVIRNGDKLEYEKEEIGGALYPVLSLTNHSCDPNVVRHSHRGDICALTAIQKIPRGGQVLDNYGYHHAIHDVQTRQSHLFSQYHFTCYCQACIEDWPRYHMLPDQAPTYIIPQLEKRVGESSNEFRLALAEVLKGSTDGKLEILTRHLTLLHEAIQRPWKEYSECQEAVKQCLGVRANHYFIRTTLGERTAISSLTLTDNLSI